MGLSLEALATASPKLKMFTGMDYMDSYFTIELKMITARRRCCLVGKSGLLVTQPKWLLPCYQQGADVGSNYSSILRTTSCLSPRQRARLNPSSVLAIR